MKEKISNEKFEELVDKQILEYVKQGNPKLWHQMAMEWNWDNSSPFLNWLVENPRTDRATALMMYWTSGPRFNKQFKDRESAKEVMGYTSSFDFTEKLEEKYLNRFYEDANFSFDPNVEDHSGTNWTKEYLDKTIVREIPAIMFDKIDGEIIEKPKGFIEGMPPELYEMQDELYEKYDIE